LMGYSDSTVTHFAFLKAGVTSFYGPSLMAGFDENGGLLPYMTASLRQMLFLAAPSALILPNTNGWSISRGAGTMKGGMRKGGNSNHPQGGDGFKGAGNIVEG